MERRKKLRGEVNRIIYVSSVALLCVHTLVPVELVVMASVCRPLEHFSDRLKSIASAHDSGASFEATK